MYSARRPAPISARFLTALHTAARAVASTVLLRRVPWLVALEPLAQVPFPTTGEHLRGAAVGLAGPAAEAHLHGTPMDRAGTRGLSSGEAAWAVATARRLVHDHWDSIIRLTDELLRRQRLSADEVRRIVGV